MNIDESDNWFRRKRRSNGKSKEGDENKLFRDLFRDFNEIQEGMNRIIDQYLKDLGSGTPKESVTEYKTSGEKVSEGRESTPIVYGYSMRIGPDGIPTIKEFGNVNRFGVRNQSIYAKRVPLVDITSTDRNVNVIVEMPGIGEENIKINPLVGSIEIISDHHRLGYQMTVDLPHEADIETAISTYNNGVLTITFDKKLRSKKAQ